MTATKAALMWYTEEATEGVLLKKVFWRNATLLKRDSDLGVFLLNLRNFQEHLIWRTSSNKCY